MSTVENRIVHMTFDNKKFERDIAVTIESIEKLKRTLDFTKLQTSFKGLSELSNLKLSVNTTTFNQNISDALGNVRKLQDNLNFGGVHSGLQKVSDSVKGFSLNPMVAAVDGVSKKFLGLATIAVSAIATIVSRMTNAGIDMVKSFSFGPIIDGFREMETNMNSIQTILANTQSKGSTLEDVNEALQKLNEYSDKTIYNFSQMAKNIGTFTAAGVDLDTSVGAIKGIANLAAISGSTADQASTAMYQLSQAISTGTLRLIDWTSVVNAGMGGEVFKTALFETGKALGKFGDIPMTTTFKEWEEGGVSFRESLEQDWLTADVLTTTLQAFTGDLTNAQLLALGYTEEQAKEMERLGRLGVASATEVKTLTALLGTLKETVATGWSDSFKLIFGDFNEAKSLFTDMNNAIGGWISKNAEARNKVLGDWKALGGRNVLIAGITNGFEALGFVLKQVKDRWREAFPAITGERLFQLSVDFRQFMANIEQFVRSHGPRFRDIMDGITSAIQIVIEVVKETVGAFRELFQHFAGDTNATDVLDFFVNIADRIKEWKEQLVDGGGIAAFFDKLVGAIKDPSKLIDAFKDALEGLKDAFFALFKGVDFGSIDGLVEGFATVKDRIGEVLASISTDLHLPQGLIDFFKSFGDTVSANTTNSLSGGFERLGNALQTIWDIGKKVWDVMTSIGDALQWAWEKFQQFAGFIGDAISAVGRFVANLGPTLSSAIKSEEFDRILDLIDSIALLLGAKGISSLGSKGLTITGDLTSSGFAEALKGFQASGGIIGSLKKNLDALTGTLEAMTTQIKANALLKIAQAMALLTASVLVLSLIDPTALGKSLTALAVGMGQLIGALALLNLMTAGPTGTAKIAALTLGLNLLASAILIMSGAIAVLAQFDADELARGMLALQGLVFTLVVISSSLETVGPGLIAGGLGMIAISTALIILGGALKIYATLSWEEIGKSLTVLAGALLLLNSAMSVMSLKAPITAPAMIAVATALVILGGALKIFATMSWVEIGKAMTVLAGSLLILNAAMSELSLKAPITAPAMIAVATSLVILGAALKIFATMSWEEIGKSMVVLFGSLLILSAALASMTNAIPGAVALGVVAVGLIILAKAIKGFAAISWKDFAKGIGLMAVSFAALGLTAHLLSPLIPALFALAGALALLGLAFTLFGIGAGLIAQAFQIMAAAGTAGVDVLIYAIEALLKILPELVDGFIDAVIQMTQQLLDAMPALIVSLVEVIGALVDGLIKLTPKFVALAKEWIGALLDVISDSSPDLIAAGLQIVLDFLKGVRDNIQEIVEVGVQILTNLIKGLIESLPELNDAVAELIVTLVQSITDHIDEIAGAGLDIIIALALGITDNVSEIIGAVAEIITTIISEIGDAASDIAEAGADALIDFLGGLTEDTREIIRAVGELITGIIDAFADEAVRFAEEGAKIVIDFMNELAEVIRDNDEEFHDAFMNLATAMVEGLVTALLGPELVKMAKDAAISIVRDAFNAAKDWLLPGSPSRRWAELGVLSATGFARGLDDDTTAEDSASGLASRATESFRKALIDASAVLQYSDEFRPTITPVLDLTDVQTQAGQLTSILGQSPLQTSVSLDAATALSAETAQSREDDVIPAEATVPREVRFEQNNYSPESLNAAKIYRQTKNLIVLTKEELEVA